MAVMHTLLVVLCNAVGGAEGNHDGIVGGGKVDVGDTGAGIGGVDNGLAVGAVIDADTGFNRLFVGGVERQRNVVKILLQKLDGPSHQLRTVGFGRTDVDIQIRCAGFDLLGGTFQDGIGIEGGHGFADDRTDAVDAFADDDKLLRLRISALVGNAQITVRDFGNYDLVEIERCVRVNRFFLFLCGLFGGGNGFCRLDVLAVAQIFDDFNGFTGADNNVPFRQLVLNFALHHGNLAGNDEGAAADLGGNVIFIKEFFDGGGRELAGCPCRQDRHTGSVGNQQIDRDIGALDLAGDEEVGQSEIDRHQAGIVGGRAVHRIDAGSDLHRLLRVGEDVLTQTVQRQSLCVIHFLHDNNGAVFQGEGGGKSGLQMHIAFCDA